MERFVSILLWLMFLLLAIFCGFLGMFMTVGIMSNNGTGIVMTLIGFGVMLLSLIGGLFSIYMLLEVFITKNINKHYIKAKLIFYWIGIAIPVIILATIIGDFLF